MVVNFENNKITKKQCLMIKTTYLVKHQYSEKDIKVFNLKVQNTICDQYKSIVIQNSYTIHG